MRFNNCVVKDIPCINQQIKPMHPEKMWSCQVKLLIRVRTEVINEALRVRLKLRLTVELVHERRG